MTTPNDAELVERVAAAASRSVKPGDVESYVGIKAALNTLRDGDRAALQVTDLGQDDLDKTPIPDYTSAEEVIFWIRPVHTGVTRVVGILWFHDGKCQLFFGVVASRG